MGKGKIPNIAVTWERTGLTFTKRLRDNQNNDGGALFQKVSGRHVAAIWS